MSESLGSQVSWKWARDFALVGAVSSFLAPALIVGSWLGVGTLVLLALVGGATGAGLGVVLARLLRTPIGALSWPLMVLGMGALGALWGVVVGLAGGLMLTVPDGIEVLDQGHVNPVVAAFIACAALAAGLQLAWFGAAYHRAVRASAPTWIAVVLACGMPLVGWAALLFLSGGAMVGLRA